MAKGKSFFGLKRGSTKSLTFQVLNGQQIVKDRVFEVKNPRTTSQMVQRMVMATATAAYSHMREIVDHSFEGISYGQQSMSAFIKENVRDLINDVKGNFGMFSYNPYQDRKIYASPFVVSKGSLSFNRSLYSFANDGGEIEINLYYPNDLTDQNGVDELLDAWQLRIGDILTFCVIHAIDSQNNWKFDWLRLKIVKSTTDSIADVPVFEICEIETSFNQRVSSAEETSWKFLLSNPDESGDEAFGAVILSRKSDAKWLRSNAAIIFPGSPVNNPTAATALATYPVGVDYILNGGQV